MLAIGKGREGYIEKVVLVLVKLECGVRSYPTERDASKN